MHHMKGNATYSKRMTEEEAKALTSEQMLDVIMRSQERIAWLERMLFSSKRDKLKTESGPTFFDEEFKMALDERDAKIADAAKEIDSQAKRRQEKASHKPRAKRPRNYLYQGLEERRVEVLPDGVENINGYDVIGEDTTRILHQDPAKVWVEVQVRPVLRPKSDRQSVKPLLLQAPAPYKNGQTHVGPEMMAQILVNKFVAHLPEYRQVKMYNDLGLKLPCTTLNDWVHAAASRLVPLFECQRRMVLRSDYLQVDEVPWRIADRRDACRKGYAWQFLDVRPDSVGLYFRYLKGSRGMEVPRAELLGYKGAVQTDGYKVYDYFEMQPDVTLLGCMAHVRRKFVDAQKSYPSLAAEAVRYIALLYTLEENLRADDATPEKIVAERKSKAMPIMDVMEAWMETNVTKCTPEDPLGKAIAYAYHLWPRLRRYAEDGRYQIDNNAVERGQRPSVLGRKNYLFSKNDDGAEDNAIFYTLLESCDVVGVNALKWLTHALSRLHDKMSDSELTALLPYNYKKSQG